MQTKSHDEFGGRYGQYVDLMEVCRLSGCKLGARSVEFCIDGDLQVKDLNHPFESLPSSFGSLAVKIHAGSITMKPCVEIKASPAKLLQSHNVFGTENLELCATELLNGLAFGMPKLFDLLNIANTSLDWIDVTYSAHVQNEVIAQQVIDLLKNVTSGQTKKSRYNKEYETTVEWNTKSQLKTLKVYLKGFEVSRQLIELEKSLQANPTDKLLNVKYATLANQSLIDWAKKCVRFEARLKHSYLEKHNIPRNLIDAIQYQKNCVKEGKNIIQNLWEIAFKDLLNAIKGAEMNIYDDKKIRQSLKDAFFTITPKGNFSYSKADKLYSFYRALLNDGYDFVKSSMDRKTFWRHEIDLLSIGLSKSQLQNLQQQKNNVIPFCRVIDIDFSRQRPDWYEEPKSFYDNPNNLALLKVA
ncbi:phage/plasmid replication protein, II/X family [Orbus wheelerorum]